MKPSTNACSTCRGTGRAVSGRCRACDGIGAAVAWGDVFLMWAWPIDRVAVRGRKIESIVRATITIAVFLGAIVIVLIAIAPYLIPQFTPAAQTRAQVFSLLGIAGILFLPVIAAFFRTRERAQPLAIQGVTPEADLAPLESLANISRERRIDIAARFDADGRTALERAGAIAERLHHRDVLPIHCFAGLLSTTTGAALFGRLSTDFNGLKERIQHALGKIPTFEQAIAIAPETYDVLFTTYVDAARSRRRSVGIVDLLTVLARREGIVRDILDDLGITAQHVVNVATWIRVRADIRDRYRRTRSIGGLRPKHGMNRAMTAIATPILDQYSEDITAYAASGYIGTIVGRDRTFTEVLRVFASGHRGVVLVGEPGVGKDGIIEGLAERMASDDVPEFLRDKRLMRISIARLVSGASASVAQERLLAALIEAARSRNIVLAIDQLEQLIGSGETGVDLGGVLATELERSDCYVIGTVTPDAYRKHIERGALGRSFERITVEEPEGDDAIQIVEARSIIVEGQQRVYFSYGALEACVRLSDRYLHDRYLPEKAIALMEEVATMVRTSRGEGQVVTADDVAKVIEEKTGVPAATVTEDEAQVLLHLEERMHERMVGQDEAIRMIAAALRRARVALREGKRPIATFLFLGPTGVGKTELAKTVAESYFGEESAMVRLDMSEYQDASSIARLIGAAPGTGGEESGQLTEAVRHQPFSLILLDELEKAHPDILNIFLQVFDDGRLTDSAGRTVDFTNAIIIATSNAGTSFIQSSVAARKSLEEIKRALLETELRGFFRPEFLNRFDGVIVFAPLTESEIEQIARLMLAKVQQQLEEKGIHFRVTDAALLELAKAGFDPQFGARPLRRIIQERVQDALANFLLQKSINRRDTAVLDAGGVITIEKAEELS